MSNDTNTTPPSGSSPTLSVPKKSQSTSLPQSHTSTAPFTKESSSASKVLEEEMSKKLSGDLGSLCSLGSLFSNQMKDGHEEANTVLAVGIGQGKAGSRGARANATPASSPAGVLRDLPDRDAGSGAKGVHAPARDRDSQKAGSFRSFAELKYLRRSPRAKVVRHDPSIPAPVAHKQEIDKHARKKYNISVLLNTSSLNTLRYTMFPAKSEKHLDLCLGWIAGGGNSFLVVVTVDQWVQRGLGVLKDYEGSVMDGVNFLRIYQYGSNEAWDKLADEIRKGNIYVWENRA